MNRRKESDWTRVLQERLRDAELPMESEDISAFSGIGGLVSRGQKKRPRSAAEMPPDRQPAARRMGWGLWAMAAVAAAAVAAVLLLRPVQRPVDAVPSREQDLLAETVIPDTIGNPDPSGDSPDARNIGSALSKDENSRQRSLPDGAGGSYDQAEAAARPLPQEAETSSNEAIIEDGVSPKEEKIPDQVGDDKQIAREETRPERAQSLSELALADLPEDTARPRRKPAGRVALRVQAATSGSSFSGVGLPTTASNPAVMQGDWYSPEGPLFYSNGLSSGSINATLPAQSGEGNWLYVQTSDTGQNITVVQQAPALPVTLGVSLSLPLSRSWVMSAGLDYTQRAGNRVYGGLPQSLTLHYLGIPVDLQYYFNPESRWRFYLGAGVHAAKCIYASGGEPLRDPLLFSGNLTAGTDFRLFPGVRLYLAPALTGHFNRSTYVNTWDDKLQFQLRAGLSFEL